MATKRNRTNPFDLMKNATDDKGLWGEGKLDVNRTVVPVTPDIGVVPKGGGGNVQPPGGPEREVYGGGGTAPGGAYQTPPGQSDQYTQLQDTIDAGDVGGYSQPDVEEETDAPNPCYDLSGGEADCGSCSPGSLIGPWGCLGGGDDGGDDSGDCPLWMELMGIC